MNPMRLGAFFIAAVIGLIALVGLQFTSSSYVFAAGSMADMQCQPFIQQCECGQVPNKQTGKCEQKGQSQNMHNCPCFDTTNGHQTTGKCTEAMHCKGEQSDGKPPEMPKLPEKPQQQPQQQQQQQGQCNCGNATTTSPTATTTDSGARTTNASSSRSLWGTDASGNACSCDAAATAAGYASTATSDTGSSYYDYGAGSGSPFTSLLDQLESGSIGSSGTNVSGGEQGAMQIISVGSQGRSQGSSDSSGVSVPGGDSGAMRAVAMGAEDRTGAVSAGGTTPLSGATGFSGPSDAYSADSVVDSSLLGQAGDLVSKAGNAAVDTVKTVVSQIQNASGPNGQDAAANAEADRVRQEIAQAQRVSTTATARTATGSTAAGGATQKRATAFAPSVLPFEPYANNSELQVGVVYKAVDGFVGALRRVANGIGDFFRGLFGVFVH